MALDLAADRGTGARVVDGGVAGGEKLCVVNISATVSPI